MQIVQGVLGTLIRHSGHATGDRLRQAACSAVFMIRYWQGIADATGCGAAVWRLAPTVGAV
jgi:hypothetical protein